MAPTPTLHHLWRHITSRPRFTSLQLTSPHLKSPHLDAHHMAWPNLTPSLTSLASRNATPTLLPTSPITPRHVVSMSGHIASRHITSQCVASCHVTSPQNPPTSPRLTSSHLTSPRFTAHHLQPQPHPKPELESEPQLQPQPQPRLALPDITSCHVT